MRSLHAAALFLSAYTTSGPEPLKILRTAPADEAAPTSVVTVTFDRPVAGSLDRTVDPKAIFTITPAVPGLVATFGTDPAAVQLTLSLYLFGLAASQLVMGPLSDRFGRRPVVLAGLTLAAVSSVAALAATSIEA